MEAEVRRHQNEAGGIHLRRWPGKAAYKMAYEVTPEKRLADTEFKTGQSSNGQKVERKGVQASRIDR